MFAFLDEFWTTHKHDFNSEFPVLLGSMSLLSDDKPVDQGQWVYWERCLGSQTKLSEEEAFNKMLDFLEINRNYSEGDEIALVINRINLSFQEMLTKWKQIINEKKTN